MQKKFLLIFLSLIIISCLKDPVTNPIDTSTPLSSYNSDLITDYIKLDLDLFRYSKGYSAPVTARFIGFLGITTYESSFNGIKNYKSLQDYLHIEPALPIANKNYKYNWAIACNAALAQYTKFIFYNTNNFYNHYIDSLEEKHIASINETDTAIYNRSVEFGKLVAESIYKWSKTDGSNNIQLDLYPATYIPPIGEGLWVPTPSSKSYFNYKPAMTPYFGNTRPFIRDNVSDATMLPPPQAFTTDTSSTYFKENKIQSLLCNNLSQEQKEIAVFWGDELGSYSPPGHSLAILSILLNTSHANMEKSVLSLLFLGVGIHDAFIDCFKIKYTYNQLRPITYIQLYIDPNWNTIIGTPPFPDYISGHSTQSGACEIIFEHFFGENFTFTDNSKDDVGYPPRTFHSFKEMADEASLSRYYGGVHRLNSCLDGHKVGKIIGLNTINKLPVH